MPMTIHEAAEQLRAAGLVARVRDNNLILGAGAETLPYYDKRNNLHRALPIDEFFIAYHFHAGVWAANIVPGQVFPMIKMDAELSKVVLAVQDFYSLCRSNDFRAEPREIQTLVIQIQRTLGLVLDIYDVHTLRVRIPFRRTPLMSVGQLLASYQISHKDEVFYIRLHKECWQLEYWRNSDMQFVMPLLRLEEVFSVLAQFYGHPTATEAPRARLDRPQSTGPSSSAD